MKKMLFLAGTLLLAATATTLFSARSNDKMSLLMRNVEALAQGEESVIEMVEKEKSYTETYKETITNQWGETISWLVSRTEVECEGVGDIPCEAGIFTVRSSWNGSF